MTNDKLIGYTVVQEFGKPYWTAELKFTGSSILEDDPNLEGYIKLQQTDTTTEETRTIFYGFPIKVSWKIKKGIIQYTMRAVTNGWYLTQQPVPRGSSASEAVHYNIAGDGPYNVVKYARRNEEMLVWDYLFNNAPTDPERASFCSDVTVLENLSDVNASMAHVNMNNYPMGNQDNLCGIYASDEMIAARSCYGGKNWDCADCQGHIAGAPYWGDGRRDWSFDYKTKTKHAAITDMALYCNRVFHINIDENSGNCYAHWTTSANADANSVEPFSALLAIDTENDDSLIDLTKHEYFTQRGTPNCVYAYGHTSNDYWGRSGEEFERSYPSPWYATSRPVIHSKQQNDYTSAELSAYAETTYNNIQGEEGNRYTANLVSTISERSGAYKLIAPGSRITISGMDPNLIDPSIEYRIMKITHRKAGGKPALTSIEFSKVTTLGDPRKLLTSPASEMIKAQIKEVEKEKKDNPTEPEERLLEPCLIQNISNGYAIVQILNSSIIYENVIHLR